MGRYPNLIKDKELDSLDQVWISDITYIRLPTTFCYLAAVVDAYSRRCVGWHLSRFIDTGLALWALEMALAARRPALGGSSTTATRACSMPPASTWSG
ncbi:MAG: DDE-type integrase/transposase/recombinase [Actinomycetota bacterium]|nr:DDE-type integrase/transposase/recombinase [Actinomycetota bacterium]